MSNFIHSIFEDRFRRGLQEYLTIHKSKTPYDFIINKITIENKELERLINLTVEITDTDCD